MRAARKPGGPQLRSGTPEYGLPAESEGYQGRCRGLRCPAYPRRPGHQALMPSAQATGSPGSRAHAGLAFPERTRGPPGLCECCAAAVSSITAALRRPGGAVTGRWPQVCVVLLPHRARPAGTGHANTAPRLPGPSRSDGTGEFHRRYQEWIPRWPAPLAWWCAIDGHRALRPGPAVRRLRRTDPAGEWCAPWRPPTGDPSAALWGCGLRPCAYPRRAPPDPRPPGPGPQSVRRHLPHASPSTVSTRAPLLGWPSLVRVIKQRENRPQPQNGTPDIGKSEFRRAEVPEPNGPQGRAAEPATGTSHACCCCLSVTAGTTRDSEPLLPTTVRRESTKPHAKPPRPRPGRMYSSWQVTGGWIRGQAGLAACLAMHATVGGYGTGRGSAPLKIR